MLACDLHIMYQKFKHNALSSEMASAFSTLATEGGGTYPADLSGSMGSAVTLLTRWLSVRSGLTMLMERVMLRLRTKLEPTAQV